MINYLPNRWRNRLCPHVRAYTTRELQRLFDGLPGWIVVHTQVFPGYDKFAARNRALAATFRAVTYTAERTPLRGLGLSHFMVYEKSQGE